MWHYTNRSVLVGCAAEVWSRCTHNSVGLAEEKSPKIAIMRQQRMQDRCDETNLKANISHDQAS